MKALSAAAMRVLKIITPHLNPETLPLAEALLAHAHGEDLATLSNDVLAEAINLAATAIDKRSADNPEISALRHDNGYTTFAIVTENKPFLFDSILGEINEAAPNVHFVVHPVLEIKQNKRGFEIIDNSKPSIARDSGTQTSITLAVVSGISVEATSKLKEAIASTLGYVNAAVRDWRAMLTRLDQAVEELSSGPLPAKKSDIDDAIDFLGWLRNDNFTFLGMREYDYVGGEKRGMLERADKPALGILSDTDFRIMRRGGEAVTTTPQIRAFLNSRDILIVAKANSKSVVHRRTYIDYIGIKRYDSKGKLTGELRVVGLFTSTAYTRSVLNIPFIKTKIAQVISRSPYAPESHSGKALLNVLESYPRDELFQINTAQLGRHAEAIIALADRPRVRVLSRIDPFDRFASILVFVPRERYSSSVRETIGAMLADAYDGHVSAYYPGFPEGGLARVHFIIGRAGGKTPEPSQQNLERDVSQIIRTWDDAMDEAVDLSVDDKMANAIRAFTFPEQYKDSVEPSQALMDVGFAGALSAHKTIDVDFHQRDIEKSHEAMVRIYHLNEPVSLSRRVPVLENMGFRVISEQTFTISQNDEASSGARTIYVHNMSLESSSGQPIKMDDEGFNFEDAFRAVWNNQINNDAYNGLILAADMNATKAKIFRAYGSYLKQIGRGFSQLYMAQTLAKHAGIAQMLFTLFDARHNPEHHVANADNMAEQAKIEKQIIAALANVSSLDEDRIIASFLNVIKATLRTNLFNPQEGEDFPPSLAFKLDPHAIDNMPEPRPYREIFVFGPQVEGLHLRFGPIARGGLRWSDRAEDYRTEVLGLVKAQQVKNAVIVPVGAKGGFLPKQLPIGGSRDEVYEAGRAAYITFINSLLSVTDNRDGDAIISPANTVRYDGDDPYLVVAADKGTAAFSDTANAISQGRGFWLDDAFASGGSAGYDHKKMGITARGAWEAVKRHFREMDKDIQNEPFTAVGVGDMSGDVFGNGMLLSDKTQLIAAFDHRDIFIDPDPDTAKSYQERKRLFDMGRSSWQDYDAKKISAGGGVFSRNQKSITLSKAAATRIGLTKTKASPLEIMQAILTMPSELLWFGGIGTYVRASNESDADVGDRANDALRVTAKQVGAKVIGEGANLGMTQRGRIEFGLHGGRCNSDAIDNSGGVNSSDVEVNIKIALQPAMKDETLPRDKRNKLLEAMTESVADLVLRNNYEQTLTISRVEASGVANISLQARLMQSLEGRGLLDRAVETLPDDETLAQRKNDGIGLTRAEIGVLLSYAKIVLFDDLVRSALPDDPYFDATLKSYFPPRMVKEFAPYIERHQLRREIISTLLCNEAVNRGGPSVISRFEDSTGMLPSVIVYSHVATRDAFDFNSLQAAIDALDNKVRGADQLALYADLAQSQRTAIGQYLKVCKPTLPLCDAVSELTTAYNALKSKLLAMLPDYMAKWVDGRQAGFVGLGLEESVAKRIAMMPVYALIPDIASIAAQSGTDITSAAKAFYAVTAIFRIGRLEHLAHGLNTDDYFDGLAQQRALDTIHSARRQITAAALVNDAGDPLQAVEKWVLENKPRIERVQERIFALADHGELTASRLTVAAGLLSDLVN